MKYRLRHVTRYHYATPVDLAAHVVHLRPRDFAHQRVVGTALMSLPLPVRETESIDHFGNRVTRLFLDQPHTGLEVTAEALVDVEFPLPPDAADRAVAIFAWHDEGRWAEIIDELDDTMRGLHSPQLLARGWATMASLYGRLERIGTPYPRPGSEDAVVIVPLFFEAGEARGMVRFGADGKIAGMAIRPAAP